MLIVALDGIAVFGVLGCFVGAFTFCPIMTDAGPLSSLEITLLGAAFTCNLWLLSREWIQMRAMIAFRTDVRPIHDPAASDEPHHEHDLPAGERAATSPAPRTLFIRRTAKSSRASSNESSRTRTLRSEGLTSASETSRSPTETRKPGSYGRLNS